MQALPPPRFVHQKPLRQSASSSKLNVVADILGATPYRRLARNERKLNFPLCSAAVLGGAR
jgi:hypothetical protein